MSGEGTAPVVTAGDLHKTFRRETGEVVRALDGVSLEVRPGTLTALVGPDGAGKTTFLRLTAGLLTVDSGRLEVLGLTVASHPQQVQSRIGYMPQKFGFYEDLSVQENLDLYADMHGIPAAQRRERYPRLLHMTALGAFTRRLASRLSGGMKQKLGLACTLVRFPDLLLLDEPTVGVDPLSRRELWEIIGQLVHDQGLTVLLSTSYLDEAERCDQAVVLHQGKVLAKGLPGEVREPAAGKTFLVDPSGNEMARVLQARLLEKPEVVDAVPEGGRVRLVLEHGEGEPLAAAFGASSITPCPPRFEDGFMVLFRGMASPRRAETAMELERLPERHNGEAVVQVRDLVRRFGAFTAVDHINFEVHRGEMFGLLGPNGAGKTTTFRMICGLLPASEGTLQVAGVDLLRARAEARRRIGYVAQKFSLYGQLTVMENLDFFASAYGLRGGRKRTRLDWALDQFELVSFARLPAGQLPGGYQQRLAMAAALLHQPEILFLDEPTSGADPLARREFWRFITLLAQQGVTVIVTTHFMEEAEYCDRIAIMDAGRILAQGTPAEIRGHARPQPGRTPTIEDAFIAIIQESRRDEAARGGAA